MPYAYHKSLPFWLEWELLVIWITSFSYVSSTQPCAWCVVRVQQCLLILWRYDLVRTLYGCFNCTSLQKTPYPDEALERQHRLRNLWEISQGNVFSRSHLHGIWLGFLRRINQSSKLHSGFHATHLESTSIYLLRHLGGQNGKCSLSVEGFNWAPPTQFQLKLSQIQGCTTLLKRNTPKAN